MSRLLILCVIATVTIASPVPDSGRVVNGTDAKPGEIPYIVSLRISTSHVCGGSIIDRNNILTAAHCVKEYIYDDVADYFTIQYGVVEVSPHGNIIGVEKIIMHENYSSLFIINDIAVLHLKEPLPEYNDNVKPVVLPEQAEQPPAGAPSVLAGWGRNRSGGDLMKILQRVDLLVYSDADCSKAHGSRVSPKYNVCSGVPEGGKGQCNGDSGGPLIAEGKQIGIVSWSVKPCTIKGYPGVYARVASYVNWIRKHLK